MDFDNENEGFEHQQQHSFDLIQLVSSPEHTISCQPNKLQQQQFLTPPISTYFQTKNCPTPPELNQIYSYLKQQSTQSPQPNRPQQQNLKKPNIAWICPQQKQLQEQFNQSNYRIIYNKFKQDRSNYKYFRQYAKNQYKVFNDQDSIEESDQEQKKELSKSGKQKSCRLDLLKIQRILSPVPKQLVFRSNFQGGNLEKVYALTQQQLHSPTASLLRKTSSTQPSLSASFKIPTTTIPKKYFLILSNDTNTIGFNQWFYFKVFNPNFDRQIKATFIIVNINKKTIPNIEQIGIQYFSMDGVRFKGVGWTRVFEGISINNKNNIRKDQNHFYHSLQFCCDIKPRDTVYFSLAIPYTLTKLKQYMQKIPQNVSILANTFCGNPIYLYRTGNINAKKSILITARQHPSQTSSSYVVEGVINKLEKSSLMTNLLKKKYQIFVIPMVNPDGVVHGNSRTNLLGYDVNRKWQIDPNKKHSYQVYNIINNLMKKIPKLQYLIDLHGHSKKLNTFAYFSTKKSLATNISLEMSEKLPWFRIEDCQMATFAPMNTLRWYAATNLNSEKSITIQTSIHGWCDQNRKVQPFTPQTLEEIGSTLIDVISRIQLQKKSTIKVVKGVKFAEYHESSDSDPQGDIIKQQNQQQNKPNLLQPDSPQKQLDRKSQTASPRRLRIKTCSTNFYKPLPNSTVRQRIKTQYAIEKLNIQLTTTTATTDPKVKRKKTLDAKIYRMKQKNITSIRRLTTAYNQLSDSITCKPAQRQQKQKQKQRQKQKKQDPGKTISNLGRVLKRIQKSEEGQKIQFCLFDKLIERRPRNFADLNSRYRDKLLSIRSKLK